MKYKLLIIAVALGVTGAAIGGGLYLAYPIQVPTLPDMTRNYLISWSAPPGTITTELNAAYKAEAAAPQPAAEASSPNATARDWPSYNGAQKVAVAAGFTMLAWPTKTVKAKVVVLGLDSASAKQ